MKQVNIGAGTITLEKNIRKRLTETAWSRLWNWGTMDNVAILLRILLTSLVGGLVF